MRSTLGLTLLLCALAWGQDLPKAEQSYDSVSIDLDKDGELETVSLTAYNIDKANNMWWGQLQVSNSSGKLIWQAPKAKNEQDPFSFGSFPYGESNLEWLGDIDGDGHIELVSPTPQSDVRPPTYRRFRWKNNEFVAMGPKMLLENPIDSGTFTWRDPIEWDGVSAITWIASLSGTPKEIIASVTAIKQDGSIWLGTAKMAGNGLGVKAVSWTKKLAPPK